MKNIDVIGYIWVNTITEEMKNMSHFSLLFLVTLKNLNHLYMIPIYLQSKPF